MKNLTTTLTIFVAIFSMGSVWAQSEDVSRSPAVVSGRCDFNIPTSQTVVGSEKEFSKSFTQKIILPADLKARDKRCSILPGKHFPEALYEEAARQQVAEAFNKTPEDFKIQCSSFFKFNKALQENQFFCDNPTITSVTLKSFSCEQKEFSTEEVAIAYAQITFLVTGHMQKERSIELVQKDQCSRAKECMNTAEDSEMPILKKLADVACRGELKPVSPSRAPAVEIDNTYDGSRGSTKDISEKEPEHSTHSTEKNSEDFETESR